MSKVVGVKLAPPVVTLTFVTMWYGLNVAFNLLNKTIFNYFPFPYTVSAIHVVVGLAYCSLTYLVGAKKASFGRVHLLSATCMPSCMPLQLLPGWPAHSFASSSPDSFLSSR